MEVPSVHKTIKIYGADVHYWIYNPDEYRTIVGVHGLRGTHHGLQFIAQELPDFRIIIPDLPGFGESSPMRKLGHKTEDYAEFIQVFIEKLKLAEPPVVLGHSFGTLIAGTYAAKHPTRVEKLILVNPIARHGNELSSRLNRGIGKSFYIMGVLLPRRLGERLLKSQLATFIMTVSLLKTRDPGLKGRAHYQHQQYFSQFHSRELVNEAFRSSVTDHLHDVGSNINAHTLLIAGEYDQIAPLKHQRTLYQKIEKARLKVIPNTGHLSHYETPHIIAGHIREFLD